MKPDPFNLNPVRRDATILIVGTVFALGMCTVAHAEPPPKIKPHNVAAPPVLYLGKWCGRAGPDIPEGSIRYSADGRWDGSCRDDDDRIEIEKDRIIFRDRDPHGENVRDCTFRTVRLTGESWPRSTKPAREDWVPSIMIRCRETGKRLLLEWVKGDQIDMTGSR